MRPALPSALPLCQSLERCRTHIEAQTPKLSHFWLSVVNRGLPVVVTLTGIRRARMLLKGYTHEPEALIQRYERTYLRGWVVSAKRRGKRCNRKGALPSEILQPHLSHPQFSQTLVDCGTSRSAHSFRNRSHNTFLFQNRRR